MFTLSGYGGGCRYVVQGPLGHSQDDCECLPFFGIPIVDAGETISRLFMLAPHSARLRVADLSADSRSHPVAYLTAELFGNYRIAKRMGELASASLVRPQFLERDAAFAVGLGIVRFQRDRPTRLGPTSADG